MDLTNIGVASYGTSTEGRLFTLGNNATPIQEERPTGANDNLA